jgi:uncharacterized membrane protein YkvA (DUF1232 family)
MNHEKYKESFSEEKFWRKIVNIPKSSGCAVLRPAITLFVLLTEPDIPLWAKSSIILALGYLVTPIDIIPDFMPGGFVDDIAVMTLLISQLHTFINEDVKNRIDDLLPEHCRGFPLIEPTE